MQITLSRTEGRPGDIVTVRAKPDNPAQAVSVRFSVGYDLDVTMQRSGDEWKASQEVPYGAPAGGYQLSFSAYDGSGRCVESSTETFTVQ